MLPQVHVQVLAATLMASGGGALGGNQDTAYEGGVAMNKISALVRTDSEALTPQWDTSAQHLQTRELLPGKDPTGTLSSDFQPPYP